MKKKSKAPIILTAVAAALGIGVLLWFTGIVPESEGEDHSDSMETEIDVYEDTASDLVFLANDDTEEESPNESTAIQTSVTYDDGHIVISDNDVWEQTLVNRWNKIPENYEFELLTLDNGKQIDERIYESLQRMFDDARSQDVFPYVTEAYRSNDEQVEMMQIYIDSFIEQEYDEETAREMAEAYVALPGTSEHQLGLALDINADMNISGDSQPVYDWLAENAYRYGFILRYPEGKENITGINYEPWHYRYVGEECAGEIYREGLCLEEYLQKKLDPDREITVSGSSSEENISESSVQ